VVKKAAEVRVQAIWVYVGMYIG